MGCGATTANRVQQQVSEREVSDLKRRLDESEKEISNLRSQLEVAQTQEPECKTDVAAQSDIIAPCGVVDAPPASQAETCLEADSRTEPGHAPLVAAIAEDPSIDVQDGAAQKDSSKATSTPQDDPVVPQSAESIMVVPPALPEDAEQPQNQPVLLPGVVHTSDMDDVADSAELPPPVESPEAPPPVAAPTTMEEIVPTGEEPLHLAIDTKGGDEGSGEGGTGSGDGASIATVIEGTAQGQTDPESMEPLSKKVEDASAEDVPQKDKAILDSAGLSSSIDSDASTCTPAAPTAPLPSCHACGAEGVDLFIDQTYQQRYCARCWKDYFGGYLPLLSVEVVEVWPDDRLAHSWAESPIPGWPPFQMHSSGYNPLAELDGEVWSNVAVRVRRDIVGSHARGQNNLDRPFPNEVLRGRYRCKRCVGEGHFTKAFLADDLTEGVPVCVKRHRNLSVEALADLMVLCHRLHEVDAGAVLFPRLIDAFFDIVGFTVESLLEGSNCLTMANTRPDFFTDVANIQHVAWGGLQGLAKLEKAGIVHNDIKPDNLMWVEVPVPSKDGTTPEKAPQVRIVDFGCARLDHREESGRNWSLAEGGAGHLGKWSPEMILRLPISHKNDVWGLAVSLCELHCGRCVWRNEADTAEVVCAQALGLCNLREGLPTSMLKRSPLDIRLLYTPQPRHFPIRRNLMGQLEVLHPVRWGLDQVLDENWRERGKAELGDLLQAALIADPMCRPSAADLLESCSFVASLRDRDALPPQPEDVAQETAESRSPEMEDSPSDLV